MFVACVSQQLQNLSNNSIIPITSFFGDKQHYYWKHGNNALAAPRGCSVNNIQNLKVLCGVNKYQLFF